MLCGGSKSQSNLLRIFSETLGVPTVRANVWEILFARSSLPPIDRNHSLRQQRLVALKDSTP